MHAISYIFIFLLSSFSPAHEFHVSKCLVNYSEEEQSLQISIHLFIDDLESGLTEFSEEKMRLCSEKEHKMADSLILKYIRENLKIKVNEFDTEYIFIGKEISDDLEAVWCYFEIKKVIEPKIISVENQILMKQFDDQKNIVSLKGPEAKKAYFLFRESYTKDQMIIE